MIKGSHCTEETKRKMSEGKRGKPSWNKGIPCSEETRKKISETLNGHIPWNKGILMSEEVKQNMSIAQLGNKNKLGTSCTKESKIKMSEAHKGNKVSDETRIKMGIAHIGNKGNRTPWTIERKKKISSKWIGKNNPRWKGGITSLTKTIRHLLEYREWRLMVFGRDNFTCQKCSKRGCYLHAHHIKSFSSIMQYYEITTLEEALECAELWNINNGITLCKECHKKIHKKVINNVNDENPDGEFDTRKYY